MTGTEFQSKRSGPAQRFPRLYPILDAELALRGAAGDREQRSDLLRVLVRELAATGVEILQYRNKRDSDPVVAEDCRVMSEAARRAGHAPMRIILNDRAALAAAAGWDGVHIGQEDLSPQQARHLVGPDALVGLSTHTEAQVIAANAEPVDYIAIGPVFTTASKSDTSPVIGLEGVRRARSLTDKPLVTIGGITRDNAMAVYEAGADSVAVISAIFGSASLPGQSPAHRAKDFLDIFK